MEHPRPAPPLPPRRFPAARGAALRALLLGACLLLPLHGGAATGEAVLMKVRQVVVDPFSRTPVVILEGAGKLLPIWIGAAEASSIARALEGKQPSRPNTHDLIRNLLDGLGAAPERITITELKESTYFAAIAIRAGERRITVDSRPSDAIAVALRTGAPIYAMPEVLRKSAEFHDRAFRQRGGVTRVMGMHVQDLTAELGKLFDTKLREGVLVAHVEPESSASEHGFRRGDVITGVDGRPVRNTEELGEALAAPERRRHTFRIQRGGGPRTIVVSPPPRKQP